MRKLDIKKDSDGEKHYWVYNNDVLVELYLSEKWQDDPMYDFIKEEEYASKEELLKDGYVLVGIDHDNDEYQTSKNISILAHTKFKWTESYISGLVFNYYDQRFETLDEYYYHERQDIDEGLDSQREDQRRSKPWDSNNDPVDN